MSRRHTVAAHRFAFDNVAALFLVWQRSGMPRSLTVR
jgi:hypothetical protein